MINMNIERKDVFAYSLVYVVEDCGDEAYVTIYDNSKLIPCKDKVDMELLSDFITNPNSDFDMIYEPEAQELVKSFYPEDREDLAPNTGEYIYTTFMEALDKFYEIKERINGIACQSN